MNDRELGLLLLSGIDDTLRLQRYLNRALDHLSEVLTPFEDRVSSNDANTNVEGARANLEKAHDTVDDVRDRMLELMDLIGRMVAQRQSAAEAYEAGYEARLVDLMAQLSSADYLALRQALAALADADHIPF